MASEITLSGGLALQRNGTSLSVSLAKNIDMTGNEYILGVQIIGITTEAIDLGDATTPGYMWFKNLDPTNFVQLALATPVTGANAFAKLLPNEAFPIPCKQTVIYAMADTAPVSLQKFIIET